MLQAPLLAVTEDNEEHLRTDTIMGMESRRLVLFQREQYLSVPLDLNIEINLHSSFGAEPNLICLSWNTIRHDKKFVSLSSAMFHCERKTIRHNKKLTERVTDCGSRLFESKTLNECWDP